MNKITVKTLNVNLIACYGKMKLDVTSNKEKMSEEVNAT